MIAAGLWVIVATSVVFAALAWSRPATSSTPPAVIVGEEARWDVAGFAELFVAQYVDAGDGDEALLAPFMGGEAPFVTGRCGIRGLVRVVHDDDGDRREWT